MKTVDSLAIPLVLPCIESTCRAVGTSQASHWWLRSLFNCSTYWVWLVYILLWSPYVIGQTIIFHPVVNSIFLLSSFFPRLISGRKKSTFWHHRTTLLGCLFAAEAYIDNRKKHLLNTDTSSTCPHNMVNFCLLTVEICWRVLDTPANFNGFRVLAALLHGI